MKRTIDVDEQWEPFEVRSENLRSDFQATDVAGRWDDQAGRRLPAYEEDQLQHKRIMMSSSERYLRVKILKMILYSMSKKIETCCVQLITKSCKRTWLGLCSDLLIILLAGVPQFSIQQQKVYNLFCVVSEKSVKNQLYYVTNQFRTFTNQLLLIA